MTTAPEPKAVDNPLFRIASGFAAEGRPVEINDWVLVLGRVKARPLSSEVEVMFQSHNEDWTGLIVLDHIAGPAKAPHDWPRCTALYEAYPNLLTRCTGSSGHSDKHRAQVDGVEQMFATSLVIGYMEER